MDVIYSRYPYIMEEEIADTGNSEQEFCCKYKGMPLCVRRGKEGDYHIVQILSTNPQDFMKKDIYPGMVLKKIR